MSLETSKEKLTQDLIKAFTDAKEAGKTKPEGPDDIIIQMSKDVTTATDAYFVTAIVETDVEVKPGQLDTAAGTTTNTGSGKGVGTIVPGVPLMVSNDFTKLVEDAYKKSRDEGAKGIDPMENIKNLSFDLAAAIFEYMSSAKVTTTITINPGQVGAGIGGAGNYTTPGPGAGTGEVAFDNQPGYDLDAALEAAFKKSMDAGAKTGCNPDDIIKELATDMSEAIHNFATSAEVSTDGMLTGGVVIVGYLTPVGAPLPAVSSPTVPGLVTGAGGLS